jgi:hypothetical protein
MPKEYFAQVSDITGPHRIFLGDESFSLIKAAYPQKLAELATIIERNRLATPSYVYRGIRRPLLEELPEDQTFAHGENIVALSCGINWIPAYKHESNEIVTYPSSGKVFFALVKLIQHDRYHGELCWWGYWPEDRLRPGAPEEHSERFDRQIWHMPHH